MAKKPKHADSTKKIPLARRSLLAPLLAGLLAGAIVFVGVRWGRLHSEPTHPAGTIITAPGANAGFDALKGRWLREDGYVIEVRDVDASGKLDAGYLNPRPINVSKAQASRKGPGIEVFLELRDTGYPGCTYTLLYDASADRLNGVYYQAAVREFYRVTFARAK